MNHNTLRIEPAGAGQPVPLDLLQLADPSLHQIHSYLQTGICYIARLNAAIIGVVVLKESSPSAIEIKNIAVYESFQGKGFGTQLLRFAEAFSRQSRYHTLVIGTGNSSIGQLALYQKAGFEIVRIEKNYFPDHYNEPIVENGIPCKHRIILEKDLTGKE